MFHEPLHEKICYLHIIHRSIENNLVFKMSMPIEVSIDRFSCKGSIS